MVNYVFTEQDELYMREALGEARAALATNDVPVGAVVVSEGRIVGRGLSLIHI